MLLNMDDGKIAMNKSDIISVPRKKFPNDFGQNPEPTKQVATSVSAASDGC